MIHQIVEPRKARTTMYDWLDEIKKIVIELIEEYADKLAVPYTELCYKLRSFEIAMTINNSSRIVKLPSQYCSPNALNGFELRNNLERLVEASLKIKS